VKQVRKRAPGAGRPPGRLKGATLSLRLPKDLREDLLNAAERNKRRSVSEEIFLRLQSTLVRDRGAAERPPHIAALLEGIANVVARIEKVTQREWHQDQFTAEHVGKGISQWIKEIRAFREFSPPDKPLDIPPAAVAVAKSRPYLSLPGYLDHLGEFEANIVATAILGTPEPGPSSRVEEGRYPNSWWSYWRIRDVLLTLRKGRKK